MLEKITSYWFLAFIAIACLELLRGGLEHRSLARQRWPANMALIIIAAGLSAAVPISTISAAYWAQSVNIGLLNLWVGPTIIIFSLGLLILSFENYVFHVASHKVPFLWRFHKIHHSDHTLDLTTTYRVHPIMHLILTAGHAGIVIMFGIPPAVVVTYTAIAFMIDISHHTTLRPPRWLDKRLSSVFITPALHHLHHSKHVSETDTNYGRDLAVWDKIFGTYISHSSRPVEDFRYGLEQFPTKRADDLNALLVAPLTKD